MITDYESGLSLITGTDNPYKTLYFE